MEKGKLYIDAGTAIVNLLHEDNAIYLTIGRLEKLISYIYDQLVEKFPDIKDEIIFNVNFESIERTVIYNNHVFELIGETIYLKRELPSEIINQYHAEERIITIIKQFVAKKAA